MKSWNFLLADLELDCTAYRSYKARVLAAPRKLIEEIDSAPEPPPRCPVGKYRFYIRVRDTSIQEDIREHSNQYLVKVGASPAMRMEGNKLVPICKSTWSGSGAGVSGMSSTLNESTNEVLANTPSSSNGRMYRRINHNINPIGQPKLGPLTPINLTLATEIKHVKNSSNVLIPTLAAGSTTSSTTNYGPTPAKQCKIDSNTSNLIIRPTPNASGVLANTSATNNHDHGAVKSSYIPSEKLAKKDCNLISILADQMRPSTVNKFSKQFFPTQGPTTSKLDGNNRQNKKRRYGSGKDDYADDKQDETDDLNLLLLSANINQSSSSTPDLLLRKTVAIVNARKEQRLARLKLMAQLNKRHIDATPIYGNDCRAAIEKCMTNNQRIENSSWQTRSYVNCLTASWRRQCDDWTLNKILKSYETRCSEWKDIFNNYVIYVPSACAPQLRCYVNNLTSPTIARQQNIEQTIRKEMSDKLTLLHPIISAMTTQFPDPRLIQYDCGKLQRLDQLLKQLKAEHHRVLIFTQMTKMLDVLEVFLNYHGHIYLRLDGATKVEQRQILMERFNTDKRIFCFILSTRSGGVGINLTGADTVIFYDSDWNPTMDAQAQDRCHRIGQTRDVNIYRLVSEKTIEVNILKKANQKRMLSDMAIEGGNFTTSYFKSSTIKDLFNVNETQTVLVSNSNSNTSITTINSSCSSSSSTTATDNITLENEKQTIKLLENALAAAEDEQDVQATKTAKAEAAAELAEFDENIPLEETMNAETGSGTAALAGFSSVEQMSKADIEVANLVKQVNTIMMKRYMMKDDGVNFLCSLD